MSNAMPPIFSIRQGTSDDASRLAVLAAQVWLHTYATEGITADIAKYVLQEHTPEKYLQALLSPASQVFVAESETGLVGLAVIRFGKPCPTGSGASVELQTLYVQEHFLGQGAGKLLLDAAQAAAWRRSDGVLWLTVNAKNTKAIAFYAHQGYAKVGSTHFVLGEGRHENHVLIRISPASRTI